MSSRRVLVANRGEIACRIVAAAADLGYESVAVHPADDEGSLHVRRADAAVRLEGSGPRAYLDREQLVAVAREQDCAAIHPGYGFLAEDPLFARMVEGAGIAFVGPTPDTLERFGDKAAARRLAAEPGVPTLAGSEGPGTVEDASALLESLGTGGAVMVKAVAGGGGRGMQAVSDPTDLPDAFERCASEAVAAFGLAELYVEELRPHVRHIEVQIVGDGSGAVTHLWERECSLQRRRQKLVEWAPAPGLAIEVRDEMCAAAVRLGEAVGYRGVGTVELLLDTDTGEWFFIETNARLQVEHTVTEELTGVDLVRTQFLIAAGASLADLDLDGPPPDPVGTALEARVNLETIDVDGRVRPTGGTIGALDIPSGPGVRVDHYGYSGYTTSPAYDSLLAKVVVHHRQGTMPEVVSRARRALGQLRIDGVETNAALLIALLSRPEVAAGDVDTGFVEAHLADLLAAIPQPEIGDAIAGVRVDTADPLAVLDHGRRVVPIADRDPSRAAVDAPMQGTIVSIDVSVGEKVASGQALLVMESMKMEHVVTAPASGIVRHVRVTPGDAVFEGHLLVELEPADVDAGIDATVEELDLDRIRPDLAEVVERHALGHDEQRPEAVEKRHATGRRTARENLADLVDDGTFREYGPLVVAAQRKRRSEDELRRRTPADGLVGGIGAVNGELFGPDRSQCVVLSYDYTVLAGTQGHNNHRKKDRLFSLAEDLRTPVVLFAEGGGGRPGDTDGVGVAGLDGPAFRYFARLSGLVPLVGITTGYCFAGNAALLGCCDVVIATAGSNIGMGGPAMIEGGGLGVFHPTAVGPMDVQVPNGVVDLPVEDEAEAVAVAKRYLAYFQGELPAGEVADQRRLRHLVPENRLRVYDVREVIETLFDAGSVLELRRAFGPGMITALARVEGRPVGVVANNPVHLAGAIDSDGADKAARFMQLCDAFDLPVIFLCDTPGIMVGPEVEKTALVRHAARMFVTAASMTVPHATIVLRKAYGLGAQAMAGAVFRSGMFAVSWPSGEFGGMGLEGAVKLGYRNELAAIEDPDERIAAFEERVARMYEVGKAVSMAAHFEIDGVIDPAETRDWILAGLRAAPPPPPRTGKKRPLVDTW